MFPCSVLPGHYTSLVPEGHVPCWRRVLWLDRLSAHPGYSSRGKGLLCEGLWGFQWGQGCNDTVISSSLACIETFSIVTRPTLFNAETTLLRWVSLVGPSYPRGHNVSRGPEVSSWLCVTQELWHHGSCLTYLTSNSVILPAPLSFAEEVYGSFWPCADVWGYGITFCWGLGFRQLCSILIEHLTPSAWSHHSIHLSQAQRKPLVFILNCFWSKKPEKTYVLNRDREKSSRQWKCVTMPQTMGWLNGTEFHVLFKVIIAFHVQFRSWWHRNELDMVLILQLLTSRFWYDFFEYLNLFLRQLTSSEWVNGRYINCVALTRGLDHLSMVFVSGFPRNRGRDTCI